MAEGELGAEGDDQGQVHGGRRKRVWMKESRIKKEGNQRDWVCLLLGLAGIDALMRKRDLASNRTEHHHL